MFCNSPFVYFSISFCSVQNFAITSELVIMSQFPSPNLITWIRMFSSIKDVFDISMGPFSSQRLVSRRNISNKYCNIQNRRSKYFRTDSYLKIIFRSIGSDESDIGSVKIGQCGYMPSEILYRRWCGTEFSTIKYPSVTVLKHRSQNIPWTNGDCAKTFK